MDNDEYHRHPAVGSTGLKLLQQSPLHFWAKYRDPDRVPDEPTPAMKIGTAWHCAVFEPAKFDECYIELPEGLDRRTKEGKQLWTDIVASGKEPMTADTMEQILAMAGAAIRHPASSIVFAQPGKAEHSMFWIDEETGVKCKFRPDFMVEPCAMFPNGLIVDGKTMEDASPTGFAKQAWNWEFHIQAAFYSDGFQREYCTSKPPEFIWLAQEKDTPYACAYYSAAADFVEYGRKTYRRLLNVLAECERTGKWPGYPTQVMQMELPVWAAKTVQEALVQA